MMLLWFILSDICLIYLRGKTRSTFERTVCLLKKGTGPAMVKQRSYIVLSLILRTFLLIIMGWYLLWGIFFLLPIRGFLLGLSPGILLNPIIYAPRSVSGKAGHAAGSSNV